jgi:microsomal dipeptidase-like Zn-dependent dipeptidase
MKRTMQSGKIAILPMLEGSDRLEGKIQYLRDFYKSGLRCVTVTYETGVLADGSDDEPRHNGISPLGRSFIKEMNTLGILIDMSHISTKSMSDILDITQAPVIFSHSNARHLCDVNRNVPDEILHRLKSNKGIIMLDMVPDHTTDKFARWVRNGDSVYAATSILYPGDKQKLKDEMIRWEAANPRPVVSIADIADHFDYVKRLIGSDHIGIGGDYDGLDYTIDGMEDVSCYPRLLTELAKRGWTLGELRKITGENYLRVFSAVEKKAKRNNQAVTGQNTNTTTDCISVYPAQQEAALKQYIAELKKEWKSVPNPIIARYEGNSFGDYHHIIFKDSTGTTFDFGQANNYYGRYKLFDQSGQYDDNPAYTGKEFKIYWDWKLSSFLCCDGNYGKAKACLPSITKLVLLTN